MNDIIKEYANEIKEELINIRHRLHMCPELAFDEVATGKIIVEYLTKWGIKFEAGIAKTGICAIVEGKNDGKTILIRTDMDALPIEEENDLQYRSQTKGIMHACGHDAHMTFVLGAAYILNKMRENINGNVKLIFQPAEEGVGGALPMIEEGILENPKVSVAIAAHVTNEVPVGKVVIKDGAVMAAADDFDIIIYGKGGHGAYPNLAIDPIAIASKIVVALQEAVRNIIMDTCPAVISICSFNGGNTYNVIPDTVHLKGTARSIDVETRNELPLLIEKVLKEITVEFGATYDFNFKWLYPPTINDSGINKLIEKSAIELLGEDAVVFAKECSMAGEDFAFFTQRVPSSYFKIGIANKIEGITYPIHSSRFNIDENVLEIGATLFAKAALEYLSDT